MSKKTNIKIKISSGLPSPLKRFHQKMIEEAAHVRVELQAYESIIQGFEVLAALAEQKGPGQAAIYRIKLDGYERYAAQLRRSLVELEHILA